MCGIAGWIDCRRLCRRKNRSFDIFQQDRIVNNKRNRSDTHIRKVKGYKAPTTNLRS